MKPERFRIGDAVSYGWQTMTQNIWFFVLVMLIFFVASGIFGGFQNIAVRANGVAVAILAIIFALLNFIVGVFVGMAQVKIGVDFCDQKQADYNDLYNQYPSFWPFLAGTLLLGLLVTAGFILLIIPGIYWGVRYQFVPYFIIDRKTGPVEAFKQCGAMTRGVWWQLFVFDLAIAGIALLGFCLCFIGSLFAIPIVLVATAYVYRALLATSPAAQTVTQPPAQAPVQPPVMPEGQ